MSNFEKAWDIAKDEEEELPPEAPFHSTEERRALAGDRDYDQHSRDNRNMMRLMPFWIHFREKGFTDEQIENLTLKQIEDFLNEE